MSRNIERALHHAESATGAVEHQAVPEIVAEIAFVPSHHSPCSEGDTEASWIVRAEFPIHLCHVGSTRSEAIKKAQEYLRSTGFAGILRLVQER